MGKGEEGNETGVWEGTGNMKERRKRIRVKGG